MKQKEPISPRAMSIGLRVFAVVFLAAGCVFAGLGSVVQSDWQAGLYGSALGGFGGRLLFWAVIAAYAWLQAGKYREPR